MDGRPRTSSASIGVTKVAPMPLPVRPNTAAQDSEDLVKRRRQVLHRSGYSFEQLDGPDFLKTPWVQPQQKMAKLSRENLMFKNGHGSVWRTSLREFEELGVGVSLYFQFVRNLAAVFFIMFLVTLPSMYIAANGSAVNSQSMDLLRFTGLSIANVGTAADLSCDTVIPLPSCGNVTQLEISLPWSSPFTVEAETGSLFIACSDLLAALVFVVFVALLNGKIELMTLLTDGNVVTAANYTVLVRGLPPDATEKEVLDHFNNLYDLSKDDWTSSAVCCCWGRKSKRRPPVVSDSHEAMEGGLGRGRKFRYSVTDNITSGPVLNATNTGNPLYLRTYIAEVVLCHPIGKLLVSYRSHTKVMMKLRSVRAAVKKYSKASVHRNKKMFMKFSARLDKLERHVNSFNEKSGAMYSQNVCAAFVTFNCEDSVLRCLQDYHSSRSWFGRLMQPKPLRFRKQNYTLQVERAPEPTDVIWENVETPDKSRRRRVRLVYALMFLILLVSAVLVFVVSVANTEVVEPPPSTTRCEHDLPAAVYMDRDYPRDTELLHSKDRDTLCGGAFIHLALNSTTLAPPYIQPTNVNGTLEYGAAPAGNACFSPCVPLPGTPTPGTCPVLGSPTAETFPVSDVRKCFCAARLGDLLASGSVVSALSTLKGDEAAACDAFANRFLLRMLLALASSLVILVMNFVLEVILRSVTSFERHMSISSQSRHLMLKGFLSQFINTALVSLLVGTTLPDSVPDSLSNPGDTYSDFTRDWYTDVGASITLAMLINIVAPLLPKLMSIALDWRRRRSAANHAMCQAEMDQEFAPPAFNIAGRMSDVLNTLFVCLFYSAGIPVMLPIAALTFALHYWFDKWAVMRFYRRPPRLSNELIRQAAALLPYGIILHLLIAAWMFGNPDVLPSYDVRLFSPQWTDDYHANLDKLGSWGVDPAGVRFRLKLANSAPSFLLAAAIVCFLVVYNTVGAFMLTLLRRMCCLVTCGKACRRTRKRLQRFGRPMFTAPYAVRVDQSTEKARKKHAKGGDQQRARQGWQSLPDPQNPGVMIETKVFTTDGKTNGVRHRRGERMLTWQVVKDSSLPSYDVIANPMYNIAVAAIRDAADKHRLDMVGNSDQHAVDTVQLQLDKLRESTRHGLLSPLSKTPMVPATVFAEWAEAGVRTSSVGEDAASGAEQSTLPDVECTNPRPQSRPVQVRRVPAGAVQVDVDNNFAWSLARDYAAEGDDDLGSEGGGTTPRVTLFTV